MRTLIIILILVNHALLAQELKYSGQVLDSQQHPVPYASIGIPGTSIGTICNEQGQFTLFIDKEHQSNAVVAISCIGFVEKQIVLSDLLTRKVIELEATSKQLSEVIIKPGKSKRISKGGDKPNTLMKVNFAISDKPGQNLGAEIGRFFNLNKGTHRLEKISFYVAYTNFDTTLFRLNIYSVKWGMPAKLLNQNQIHIQVIGPKKGWVEFDLSPHELYIDQTVIVALEWIGHSKKGSVLGLNLEMPVPHGLHYYKFGSKNKWKRFPGMASVMNIETTRFR
jgi:hypothetical protein